ncbi:Allantoin transport protein [Aminobacter sp. MSH1]|uniref:NCS1 family nucleobase:cation symporter-1 n=1 Tax=Aminobacter sp. MSH1 TaxID=374606 RepID=UPI000D36F209|nr:NCS1 family nucleobase:cation symporter-1 [Aminobacter sp. MSH1]AWC21250.1 Allantoin transport protein [Aminobacter sp. MSH1]
MQEFSRRLFNEDLAPVPIADRHWGVYSVFAMWMAIIHSIANYAFATGLFLTGLKPWQIVVALLVGVLIDLWFMNRMGVIGHRTGVPFAVLARASFGIYGANIPALVRATMAIFWYGIQTWLASSAVVVLAIQIYPPLVEYSKVSILGLSQIGWVAFLLLSALQLVILNRGMEYIRKLQDYVTGPIVWIIMMIAAGWLMHKSGWQFSLNVGVKDISAGEQFHQTLVAIGLTAATWFTLILNFADYARFTKTENGMKLGNRLGLPLNYAAFALASVLTSIGSLIVFGKAISDPVELITFIDNPAVTIVGAVAFILATLGINVVGNFVSAAYDISNVSPDKISFRRGGLISGIIAIVILPWHLYSSPIVINYFLGALAAFLAPLVGIILVDYYKIRSEKIDVDALYSSSVTSKYYYYKGFNLRAIAAFLPSAGISCVLALVPAFAVIAPFSWIVGLVLSVALYSKFMKQETSVGATSSLSSGNASI